MLEGDHGPVGGLLHEVWQSVRTIDSGQVADYIPELAKADPSTCGLSLATLDGSVYTAGDLVPFTIQSVSKPFVYALALADSGADTVLSKIGAEPTGDPFNTISLDDVSGKRTTTRDFTSGTVVFNEGDASDGLYSIGAGQVSTDVRVRGQRARRRLNSMAAGSSFGELALVDGRPRSTRIAALESTICFVLSPAGLADLRAEAPDACAQLTLAIARGLSQRLRASTSQVAALEES